jgi:sec-independent protein translocase protein TatB
MRRMSNHLRSGFEAMIHEAEMEEMNRKWREQNEAIMLASPVPPEGLTLPPAEPESFTEGAPSQHMGAIVEPVGSASHHVAEVHGETARDPAALPPPP